MVSTLRVLFSSGAKMPEVEFVGPSAQNQENVQANTCRLVNLYRQPTSPGGRTGYTLESVPGTTSWLDLNRIFLRDMRQIGTNLWVLSGDQLVRITPNKAATSVGTVVSAAGGHLFGDEAQVSAVQGGSLYVYDGTTTTQPTVTPFTNGVNSGDYLGGYTVVTEEGTNLAAWSDLGDATTFAGTDFAQVGATEDALVRNIAINGKMWFFKENSYEIWGLTGRANQFAFARIPGAVRNVGLKSKELVTTLRDYMMFVGSDGRAYITDGMNTQRVSTSAVETAIAASTADRCFSFENRGASFFVIRFRDRPAYMLVMTQGPQSAEWSERASGANLEPWGVVSATKFNDTWLCGDESGKIYTLSQAYTDAGAPLVREATSSTLTNGGNRFRIKRAEIYGHVAPKDQSNIPGSDLRAAVIIDDVPDFIGDGPEELDSDDLIVEMANPYKRPSVDIAFSRDNGLTYGEWRTRSMGKLGEYENRVVLRSIGQFRQATMKVRVADNARLPLNSKMVLEII